MGWCMEWGRAMAMYVPVEGNDAAVVPVQGVPLRLNQGAILDAVGQRVAHRGHAHGQGGKGLMKCGGGGGGG